MFDYPQRALKNSRAKGPARLALLILACHARNETGECYPSIKTIAAEMNVTERSAARAIAELKRLGEISVRKRGHGRSALYKILLPTSERDENIPDNSVRLDEAEIPTNLTELTNIPDRIDMLDENIPDNIVRLDEAEIPTNLTELTNIPDNSVIHELPVTNTTILTNTNVLVSRLSPPPAILEKSIPEIKKLDCDIDTLRELHRLEGEKEKPRKSLMTYLDGRINPPPLAVEVYREITQRYPARVLYDIIAETVGDDEGDLTKWREVVKNYLGNGWNPKNINGMLEKFRQNWNGESNGTYTRHENPPQNSAGGQKQSTRRNEPPLNAADIEQQRRLDAMFPRRR